MTAVNDWNNYSNWVYEDVPPYSHENNFTEIKFNNSTTSSFFYSRDLSAHQAKFTYPHLKKEILTDVRIEFDCIDRINKPIEHFSQQQVYQYFKTNPKDGIYVYSFSLNPKEYQPIDHVIFQ